MIVAAPVPLSDPVVVAEVVEKFAIVPAPFTVRVPVAAPSGVAPVPAVSVPPFTVVPPA